MLQGMSTLLSKLLSFCLSLSPECSTAVLSCTCPDRLGECHSNFEHTRNTNSLHHRHICVVLQDVFASREKISKSVRLYLYIYVSFVSFCSLFLEGQGAVDMSTFTEAKGVVFGCQGQLYLPSSLHQVFFYDYIRFSLRMNITLIICM